MTRRKSIFLASILVAWVGIAQAQTSVGSGGVESKLEVNKVVMKDGKESLEPAGAALPGDVLQYSSIYLNRAKVSVSKLEATLPIPVSTELILASIRPDGARGSTDGVSFSPLPLMRKVRQPDGKEVLQPVPARDYRALRWSSAELPGEKSATFVARVKVLQDAPVNARPTK